MHVLNQTRCELLKSLETPRNPLYLRVVGDGLDTECVLASPVTVVGSRGDCDLALRHTNVSNVHCALVRLGDAVVIVDLCSRQGTFVNDERVHSRTLQCGVRVRVGPVELIPSWVTSQPTRVPRNVLAIKPPLTVKSAEQIFELRQLPAVIGRRRSADIFLDTPNVSLAHALLVGLDGRLLALDLGSRSGTIVNGRRVDAAWLNQGDTMEIGGETLTIAGQVQPSASVAEQPLSAGESDEPEDVPPSAEDAADRTATSGSCLPPEALHELALRSVELDAREAVLRREIERLEHVRRETGLREQALAERRSWLRQRLRAVRQIRSALRDRHAEVQTRGEDLVRRERELAEHRGTLDKERLSLEAQRRDIERRQTALTAREAALRATLAKFEQAKELSQAFAQPQVAGLAAGAAGEKQGEMGKLPGPLVADPIFGESKRGAPAGH